MGISFGVPTYNDKDGTAGGAGFTHGLGYSYSDDPNFMYCADDLTEVEGSAVNWWLPFCGLSGGSSGGPWLQPATGSGPIISVNSWGYTTSPGMAGPKLSGNTASCLFNVAKGNSFAPEFNNDGDAGVVVVYCPYP